MQHLATLSPPSFRLFPVPRAAPPTVPASLAILGRRVYHALSRGGVPNAQRYTPRGMVYTMAQLDYPVQNILDRVWSLWADDIGEDTRLADILDMRDCSMIVGNPWCACPGNGCPGEDQTPLCNHTFQSLSMARYCRDSAAFEAATLGQLRATQTWPMVTEQDQGIATLWYNSLNMVKHAPKPFHLYVANALNSTAGMNVVHNALYARNYARYAEQAGINYTVYYTDYVGMRAADRGTRRYSVSGKGGGVDVFNYRSNFGWDTMHDGVAFQGMESVAEQTLFICHAHGIECTPPAPAPPPPPPPPPAPCPALPPSCYAALQTHCATARQGDACDACIRQYARQEIDAGCGPKEVCVRNAWCTAQRRERLHEQ